MPGQSFAIVGAGLAGRLMAWQLLQEGAAVTLIEGRDRQGGTSAGLTAAAMIAPYTEAALKDGLVRDIGVASMELWPKIIADLEQCASLPIYYRALGTLVVAHGSDREDWSGFNSMAASRLGESSFQRLDRERIRVLEPGLAERFAEASYFPDEAVLSNHQLYQALNEALEKYGVNWLENHPVSCLDEVWRSGRFDWVIDCRGLGAFNESPDDSGISQADLRGVRGELIRVYAPEVNIQRTIRLIHPRYPLYVAPHGGHVYVVGATEIESDAMHDVTVRSALELLSALYIVHSGFAEARILSMEANCRPAYPDNMPRVRVCGRTISVNGLYRHGYLFAPALLADVHNYINGDTGRIRFGQLFDSVNADVKNENYG